MGECILGTDCPYCKNERLTAENEKLRSALIEITDMTVGEGDDSIAMFNVAYEALSSTQESDDD